MGKALNISYVLMHTGKDELTLESSTHHEQDMFALSLVPSDDRITAFVVTHMGSTDEALASIRELKSYDKLAVGRYRALLKGIKLDLSEEDRKEALTEGFMFEKLYQYVASQHVLPM